MQRPRLRLRGARFHPAQRGRTGQRIGSSQRRLHQHILAQPIVIVQILVPAAQSIDALRQQVAHRMHDPAGIARIAQYRCRGSGQTNALIDLLEQHHSPVAGQIPTAEVGLDQPPTQLPKSDLIFGTLWHGEASLQIARNSLESFTLRRFRLLADEISGLKERTLPAMSATVERI
jgi:hypothetical protein